MPKRKTFLTAGLADNKPEKETRKEDRAEAEARYLREVRQKTEQEGREPEPTFLRDLWERIRSEMKRPKVLKGLWR